MSALTAAQLAVLAQWDATSDAKIQRVRTASIPLAANTGGGDDWGGFFSTLAASTLALDAALAASGGYFAAPQATITALKAVAAADREDKQMRVVEDNGLGQRSIYVFDSASSATADDVSIIAPTAGTGRWFLLSALPANVLPVKNSSGGAFIKGQPLSIGGYDVASGRFLVLEASTDGSQPPAGAAFTALANGASGLLLLSGSLTSLALNTSGASLNDPVFCSEAGALSLTPVADTGLGSYIVGVVSVVSSTGGVAFTPPWAVRQPGRARGTATITSAVDEVIVAVGTRYNGLSAQVSFAGDPGTAVSIWSTPVSAGNLTIKSDAAPGADTLVCWSIDFEQ
jgi:hypothetical protein